MSDLTAHDANGLADPLPQVGAILHLDTRLPERDTLLGNRHWKLSGSCVLVSSSRILSIWHVLDRHCKAAVFFPYHGIFPLRMETLEREPGQDGGDNLALVEFEGSVEASPLSHLKVSSYFKHRGYATVCGFGLWHGAGASRYEGLDGLQRRYRVDLGLCCWDASWGRTHYDNLDLIWTSAKNGGLAAGRANSGGPLLWGADEPVHPEASGARRNGFSYVGISRERKTDAERRCDLQVSSWIGWDRRRWLDGLEPGGGQPCAAGLECRVAEVPANSAGSPTVLKIPIPDGAAQARCTLNGTDGLRLQMKLQADPSSTEWLQGLSGDNYCSGRFLCREAEWAGSAQELSVAVAPVAAAPVGAEKATVQVCCRFL